MPTLKEIFPEIISSLDNLDSANGLSKDEEKIFEITQEFFTRLNDFFSTEGYMVRKGFDFNTFIAKKVAFLDCNQSIDTKDDSHYAHIIRILNCINMLKTHKKSFKTIALIIMAMDIIHSKPDVALNEFPNFFIKYITNRYTHKLDKDQKKDIFAQEKEMLNQLKSNLDTYIENEFTSLFNRFKKASEKELQALQEEFYLKRNEVFGCLEGTAAEEITRQYTKDKDLLRTRIAEPKNQPLLNPLHKEIEPHKNNPLLQRIEEMHKYGEALSYKDQSKGKATRKLAEALRIKANAYISLNSSQQKSEFKKFQRTFKELLHSNDKLMSTHRSWGYIVANIALALSVIGLFPLVYQLYHSKQTTGKFLFFGEKTTRERKISAIEQEANNIRPSIDPEPFYFKLSPLNPV